MEAFGPTLRRLRMQRGLSLRGLSAQVNYDYGYLGQVERGVRQPTAKLASACDRALNADGALVRAYENQAVEHDMQRRTVLRTLAALAAGSAAPLVALEAVRHGIGHAVDADHDEWQQIALDYGHAFYTTPPIQLMQQLTADLTVLQEVIAAERASNRASLYRAAGQLSVLVALTLVGLGQPNLAGRWWYTARSAADRSGDVDAQVMVRGWEVVNGCYDGRPLGQVIALSEEAVALAGRTATAAVAGMLGGRAQVLALAGRHSEAVATLRQVADVTDRLPAHAVSDAESLWCWPEHRLRHTESYVYAHCDNVAAADAAQERALQLYPDTQARLRTQVGLHRAACLVRSGDVGDGLRLAVQLLDELPADQHNALVYEIARQVADALPSTERDRTEARDLYERLPPTVGRYRR